MIENPPAQCRRVFCQENRQTRMQGGIQGRLINHRLADSIPLHSLCHRPATILPKHWLLSAKLWYNGYQYLAASRKNLCDPYCSIAYGLSFPLPCKGGFLFELYDCRTFKGRNYFWRHRHAGIYLYARRRSRHRISPVRTGKKFGTPGHHAGGSRASGNPPVVKTDIPSPAGPPLFLKPSVRKRTGGFFLPPIVSKKTPAGVFLLICILYKSLLRRQA